MAAMVRYTAHAVEERTSIPTFKEMALGLKKEGKPKLIIIILLRV